MLDISTLPKMETVDCLRSGALVVAVTALLIGTSRTTSRRKSRDSVGLWLLGESIGMSFFGLLLLALPDVILGHVTTGKLDPFHLFAARGLGGVIIGTAITSYLFIDSPNRDAWLFARLMSALALVISMAMAHSKPAKKGTPKYNEKHLTFGLLAAVLWLLGTLCVISRLQRSGYQNAKPGGIQLSSRKDVHMLIDVLFCTLDFVLLFAYPTFLLNDVIAPDFKQDHLHAHLWRVAGVFLLSLLLIAMINFQTDDRLDKRAYGLGRLTMYILACPVCLWYFWWYPFYSATMQAVTWSFNISVLTNLAFVVY